MIEPDDRKKKFT